MKRIITYAAFLVLLPAVAAARPAAPPPGLKAAVNGPQRSATHVARDKYRHPLQTLTFFGIRPNMRVVEVLPGGGWYTEILAPFLRKHGHLIEATPPVTVRQPFMHRMAERYAKKLAGNPKVYGHVKFQAFEIPGYIHLGPPGTADMVVTFRNMHDLVFSNVHGATTDIVMQKFLHAAYTVLKPGGILGIVAHRADPAARASKSHMMGRLPQAYVIHEAREAGFHLAGTSEVNANPKDPRNMPVWYLPPSFALKAKHHAKYARIGEADNMTLKFIKPAH